MEVSVLFFCIFVVITPRSFGQREIKYTIDKAWNGQPIDIDVPVTLILTNGPNPSDLVVNITAPYFADPPPDGRPGHPFLGLWNYEVVELFFLNDLDQYLEVEIGPFGHHLVLLLSGVRNTIRHSLPLKVTTANGRHIWQSTAVIPGDYLPPNVTRFNAYAVHGPTSQRVYWSLYPTDGTTESPDFHNLQFFGPIDLDSISPAINHNQLSAIWDAALRGIIIYELNTQWNGRSSTVGDVGISLQGFQGGVEVNFTVWNNVRFMPLRYATFIFQNVKEESLKLILQPSEKHSISLLREAEVLLQETSTMDFRVIATNEHLNASILIPPDYFPANVTLINAYFTFGISALEVISLRPTVITDSHIDTTTNLENSDHFAEIDFETVIENNLKYSFKWQTLGLPFVIITNKPEIVKDETNAENIPSATSPTKVLEKDFNLTLFTENINVSNEDKIDIIHDVKDEVKSEDERKVLAVGTQVKDEILGAVKIEGAEDKGEGLTVMDAIVGDAMNEGNAEILENVISTTTEMEMVIDADGGIENVKVEVQEEKITDSVDKNENLEEVMVLDATAVDEGLEVDKVAGEEKVKPGELEEVTVTSVEVIKDEGLEKVNVKGIEVTDEGLEVKEDILVKVLVEDAEVDDKVLEVKDANSKDVMVEVQEILSENIDTTTSEMEKEVIIEIFPSRREEAPRRIEDEISDRNVLQIPFKISFISEKENQKNSNIVSTSPMPSTGKPVESDIEDTVDRLLDILNSGTNKKKFDFGLLPPPHPICFTPGLVADNFRCQVFYECVMENGNWEVYNWRCKRGYFYDAQKVACVRGYC